MCYYNYAYLIFYNPSDGEQGGYNEFDYGTIFCECNDGYYFDVEN